MSQIYRAVYTGCANGLDFQSKADLGDGLKLFSTSGNMGQPREVLSFIKKEIERDTYDSGMRAYTDETWRYFYINNLSVLLHTRLMPKEETGSKIFCIVKALMGDFNHHPVEYISSKFFNGNDFFFGYRDANDNEITTFKQLLTYHGHLFPPPFQPLPSDLFDHEWEQFKTSGFSNSYPVMKFEHTGAYVHKSKKLTKYLQAVVCHLIKQYGESDENKRKCIVIRGTSDQIRFMFAAIGYAFSSFTAKKLGFSIGLPSSGFAYNFATSALVGWLSSDPDVEKVSSLPHNLVYLEDLDPADEHPYYSTISNFDDEHLGCINFCHVSVNIMRYQDLHDEFNIYRNFIKWLASADNNALNTLDLSCCLERINYYISSNFYISGFPAVLIEKLGCILKLDLDSITYILRIYEGLSVIITQDCIDLVDRYNDVFVEHFVCILSSILADENDTNKINKVVCEPSEVLSLIEGYNRDLAHRVATYLASDKIVSTFNFSICNKQTNTINNLIGVNYVTNKVYPNIAFFAYILRQYRSTLTKEGIIYICKAFNAVMIHEQPLFLQNIMDAKFKQSRALIIYNSIFKHFQKVIRVYRSANYSATNVDCDLYEEMFERSFLHDFTINLNRMNSASIADRLANARLYLDELFEMGFSKDILTSLYYENYVIHDTESLFHYMHTQELFELEIHRDLLCRFVEDLCNKIMQYKQYTEHDDTYLQHICNILQTLEVIDINIWKDRLPSVDNLLGTIFNKPNWKEWVVSNRSFVVNVASYLYNQIIPHEQSFTSSIKIQLCAMLYNSRGMEYEAILQDQHRYRTLLLASSHEYKQFLLRIGEDKQLSLSFYIKYFVLFADEQILEIILDTLYNSNESSPQQMLSEFVRMIVYEYCSEYDRNNLKLVEGIDKLILLSLKYIISGLFFCEDYTMRDEQYLDVILQALAELEHRNVEIVYTVAQEADRAIDRLYDLRIFMNNDFELPFKIKEVTDYLASMDVKFDGALRFNLLYSLRAYNMNSNARFPDNLFKKYLHYNLAFSTCSEPYKIALLRSLYQHIEMKSGAFYLDFLMLFKDDTSYLERIIKRIGASKSSSNENMYSSICREYITKKGDGISPNNAALIYEDCVIYSVLRKYYFELKDISRYMPTFLSSEKGVLKEFENLSMEDPNIEKLKNAFDKKGVIETHETSFELLHERIDCTHQNVGTAPQHIKSHHNSPPPSPKRGITLKCARFRCRNHFTWHTPLQNIPKKVQAECPKCKAVKMHKVIS